MKKRIEYRRLKPTKAQLAMLQSLVDGPQYFADYYQPAVICARNGWVERERPGSARLRITASGLAVLKGAP